MAVGDVYQVVLNYRWNNEIDCKNVFYYIQSAGGSPSAANLNLAFSDGVATPLLNLAPEFCVFTTQQVTNIHTPTDYAEGDYANNAGDRTEESDPCPSFLALQYKSTRPHPGTRSARKRFPFLYESDIDGNNVEAALSGSVVALAVANALNDIISNGGKSFNPVVVHRPIILGTNPDVVYELTSQTWSVQTKVSTQNSRKT